jgi:hypothetical protein
MKQLNGITRGTIAGCGGAALTLLAACSAVDPGSDGNFTGKEESAITGNLQIQGRVTTPTGAPISGVKLTLAGLTSKQVTTNAAGTYAITGLAPGSYTVTPSKTGLKFCSQFASLPVLKTDVTEDFSGSAGGCQAPAYQRKVSVLIYDPIFTNTDGSPIRLSAYQPDWQNPAQLADSLRRSMESITNGRVKFVIEKWKTIDTFPTKIDGFQYTQESYLECYNDPEHASCHSVDTPDIAGILDAQGICSDVNSGVTDELWIVGGPWFGFWETQLAGPGAFFYNSPPVVGTTCNKLLPIVGINNERTLAEAVHNNLHRTEATMSHVYGSWQEDRIHTNWDRFGLVAAQSPSFGFSGCGTAHYAPTSTEDYTYDNPTPVQSTCDDFLNYPNIKFPPTSALKTITCQDWGCSELGFYRYFFQHLPKASGMNADGRFNDWWRYVVNPNDIALTVPTVTCSSELEPGWCQAVVDSDWGTCNTAEWSTATVPTGWVKIATQQPRPVKSITLYDRACDERVLSGHLEFSNGSPNIAFGALENTGMTGTKITFPSTKTLSWVKVFIDSSSGPNPGIAEVVFQ